MGWAFGETLKTMVFWRVGGKEDVELDDGDSRTILR